MKKLLISLLTMVIALSSMAGCVDKESEQSNNNSTQEVSAEESITEVTEVSTESMETSIQEPDISAASDQKSETPTEKSEVSSDVSGESSEGSVASTQNSQTPTEKSDTESKAETSKTSSTYIYPESISLNTHTLTLTSGDTYQLTANISPSNASTKSTEWHWTNNSVLELSSDGVVTAKKPGTCMITVKTTNNKTDTCTVTVKAKPQPQQSSQQQSSSQSSKQESSVQETSFNNTGIYAAYAPPYDWDTVIADLRKVGEEQYGMVWEESLYVRNKGTEYGSKYGGCGFPPPTTTQSVKRGNGKALREACIEAFEYLKYQSEHNGSNNGKGETLDGAYFKIVVEDIGEQPYKYYGDGRIEYEHVYWIYLLYT